MLTEEVEQIEERGADRPASPFGQGQVLCRTLEAVSEYGGQEQQAIDGHLELWETGHGLRIADLALRDPDPGFLVAVIALNLPALDVGLQQGGQV